MSDPDNSGAELAFGVLGPLEASYAGVALPLGGGRQRAVLALLVCEAGHPVPVERLLQGLWGESVPPGAVTSVQTYVFHLRQVLEPGRARGSPGSILVTVPGGYRLDMARRSVDAARFEEGVAAGDDATRRLEPERAVAAYSEALSLWRGDVLADLADYDFVAPYRARLDELRASAQQSRVQAELDLGHHRAVLVELGVLLSENPLREGLHAQRILALYRSGRQSDALAAYRELRSVLDTELGIEPSAPLQELNTRVLRQDPTLDWTPTAQTTPARVVPTASPALLATHLPPRDPYLREGQRRRLPALAVVVAAVAALAGGAGLPAAPPASAHVSANTVSEIDASGKVLASVPVGTNPIALASSHGAIWAVNASDDTVSKINPATHAVEDLIDVGDEPRAIAVAGEDLWVTNFRDDTVSRINVEVGREVDKVAVGRSPDAIAVGPAGLWVANSGDNTVQRIDTTTDTAGTAVEVGDGPDGLAVDDVSVWVANGREGSVMRIDGRPGDRMGDKMAVVRVGSGPRGIVRLGDDVWVADELSQTVTRIPVATGQPHPIDVGDGPTSVAVLDGSVWVTEEYSGDLLRIDPDTTAVARVDVDAAVRSIVVADGHLWVAAGAFPASHHRGGTLRVAAAALPGKYSQHSLDPAGIYDLTSHEATRMVYDGLLAYRYSSADAQVLIPDLARAVPEPTDDGLTYIFNLRPGIRYSTGAEVHASDFVRGVRRALLRTGPDLYGGIVGARACVRAPTSCDLGNGVVTDDASGRVTFHLVAPDPQFLYMLTLLVVPAPRGTPWGKLTSHPLPGTGPYRIATYVPGRALTMTRNPYFDEWSAPAQPAGFPDVVTWVKVADTQAAADAVREGRADLAELTPLGPKDLAVTSALVEELSLTHPDRLHRGFPQATNFGVVNSSMLPFSKLKARRALNFAVDRDKVVELSGGPNLAVPTCQLMPPTMPSYQRYCPYTTGPPDGDYQGPDLARAQELVRRSGTRGMKVTVTDLVGDYNPELDDYFAHVLRRIGYDASVDRLNDSRLNENRLYNGHNGFQVVSGGWIADFPLPSNFYGPLSCDRWEGNYPFGHCNQTMDARAAAATEKLQTDPAGALRDWTEIERDLTNQAPLVAVSNFVDWWTSSERVGNYQTGAEGLGPLMSQLWVQ